MTKRHWTLVALVIVAISAGAWWTWPDREPPLAQQAPVSIQLAPVEAEARLPGRTYLDAAQLRQAYQAGDLDRPIKSLLAVDRKLEYGGYHWDDEGVGDGQTWIRVDLKSQILSVFRAGHEIGTAVILYGAQSKQTPPGTYPILAKARKHRSSLYDADMPFTLRLTDDGISIHASNVRWGAATHGCIGVPYPFAEKLFDAVSRTDEVVVLGRPSARVARGQV